MSTQIDWRAELDSSFGAGADRPPTDYLVPARAALRKRRTAMGAAALVSVIVVGGTGWALAPGESSRAIDGEVATDSSSAASNTTDREPRVSIHRVSDASLDDRWAVLEGEVLNIAQDAEVGDWVANPLGYMLPNNSVGVQVFRGEEERWMLLTSSTGGSTTEWEPPNPQFELFQDWLTSTVANQPARRPEVALEHPGEAPALVRFQGGHFRANTSGIVILEEHSNPEMPRQYAPAAGTAAVEYTFRGDRYFGWARDFGDAVERFEFPAAEDETMEDFLTSVRESYRNGEATGRFLH